MTTPCSRDVSKSPAQHLNKTRLWPSASSYTFAIVALSQDTSRRFAFLGRVASLSNVYQRSLFVFLVVDSPPRLTCYSYYNDPSGDGT